MSRLKLFISHSSRLDNVDAEGLPLEHNWNQLKDTCAAIRQRYPNRVEVLVDVDELKAGDRWNNELHRWLAECHVAIILFSKRAIEKSDWVAKEATILSWRAELDPNFRLIPVMLDGQTEPADLAKDFLEVLRINQHQCIPNATTAEYIVDKLAEVLGEEDELCETPLEHLQAGIEHILQQDTTEASLRAALQALGIAASAAGRAVLRQQYAEQLARAFLKPIDSAGASCFTRFQQGFNLLDPPILPHYARDLFKKIRSLWVEPGIASAISLARQHKIIFAMSSQYLTHADDVREAECYTLERLWARAEPGSDLYQTVHIEGEKTIEQIQIEICERFFGPGTAVGEVAEFAQWVNEEPKTVLLVVSNFNDNDDPPDARFVEELQGMIQNFERIAVFLNVSSRALDDLPKSATKGKRNRIRPVQPRLDLEVEKRAYRQEGSARNFLNNKYGVV